MVESGDKARGSRGDELLECPTMAEANLENTVLGVDGERRERGVVVRRGFPLHHPPDDLPEDACGMTRLPGDEVWPAHVSVPRVAGCRSRSQWGAS